MGKPFDYNPVAQNYSVTRFAVPWVVEPLLEHAKSLKPGSAILEIGCGTGNYIIKISQKIPENNYYGFDLSDEMLKVAASRTATVKLVKGDAETLFPYSGSCFDMCYAVDVIHHIVNIQNFFNEISRCIKQEGKFILVTDLEQNMRKRSLSKFFPEILEVEIARYPSFEQIIESARDSGLKLNKIFNAEGFHEINEEFLNRVKSKCSSSMRLIPDNAHKRGIERIVEAMKRNEKWFSSYSIIIFEKTV